MQRGTTGIPRLTKGGGGPQEIFKNQKVPQITPNFPKLSENGQKEFLSTKQLVLTDNNMF